MKTSYQITIEKTKTPLKKYLDNIKRYIKKQEKERLESIRRDKLIEELNLKINEDICIKNNCIEHGTITNINEPICFLNKDGYGSEIINKESIVPTNCLFFNDMVKRIAINSCNEDIDRMNLKWIKIAVDNK